MTDPNMTLEEKKQIYLDRFPAIIGKRMAEQFDGKFKFKFDEFENSKAVLIHVFNFWDSTEEDYFFWQDIADLYRDNETIEHQQILDIFHKHGIKP